jgi:hypothetical protein
VIQFEIEGVLMKRFLLIVVVLAVNFLIVRHYLESALWVLRNASHQAISGAPQEWSMAAVVISLAFLFACAVLILVNVTIFVSERISAYLIFVCAFAIGLIELYESVSLHIKYGTNFSDPDQYILGPSLIIWAFMSFYFLARKGATKTERPVTRTTERRGTP